jgi:membrane-bound serine protease (ClpP class)
MTALIVVLLVTGASLLVAEAHMASYGVLGFSGAAAVVAAAVLAVGAAGGGVAAGLGLAVPLAVGLAAVVLVAARKSLEVRHRRPKGGAEGLIGRVGTVRRPLTPVGDVFMQGELWRARRSWDDGDPAPAEGESIVVEQVHGLTLLVRRAEEWEVFP